MPRSRKHKLYYRAGIVATECGRWAIQDSRRQWWTGEDFARNKCERQLYVTEADARDGYADMQRAITAGVPLRTFVVPLWVAVHTNGVFDLEQLAKYMNDAFEFSLDFARIGTGPTRARSKTEVEIDWSELQALPRRDSDNRQRWLWGPW